MSSSAGLSVKLLEREYMRGDLEHITASRSLPVLPFCSDDVFFFPLGSLGKASLTS